MICALCSLEISRACIDKADNEAVGVIKLVGKSAFIALHAQPFTLTMQRNPRWHVEVSMGCAMRAAGR